MSFQLAMIKVMQFFCATIVDKDGKPWTEGNDKYVDNVNYGNTPDWIIQLIVPIMSVLNTLLIPLIIILGVAGMIYGIVLGVQYSKAETADKRDELKKRLISAVIGIVIALVVMIVMKVFLQYAPTIFNWVEEESGTDTTTTPAT